MEGKSALTYAIKHKKIRAVNAILEYVKENNKANFLKRYEEAEFTYLQIAAMTDDVKGTKALLDLQDKDEQIYDRRVRKITKHGNCVRDSKDTT